MKNSISDFALYGGEKVFSTFRTTTNMVPPDREVFLTMRKKLLRTDNSPITEKMLKNWKGSWLFFMK